jgi:5-methylcytosine-specific restriction endonuclease McrA
MMKLSLLSDQALLLETKAARRKEQVAMREVLEHLEENERRLLYAKLGFESLSSYAQKELNYTKDEASARISAMRLMREVPQVKEKLDEGDLNLTHLTLAKSLFHQKKEEYSTPEKKSELLLSFEGKSKLHCQRIVATICPEALIKKETLKPVNATHTELKLVLENELLEKLERLKNLLGKNSYTELLDSLAQKELEKQTAQEKKDLSVLERQSKTSRSTTPKLRKIILRRDEGQCTWVNPETKKRCEGREHLQVDHIMPYALGGETKRENLRLLCFAHNQLEARKYFGAWKKE